MSLVVAIDGPSGAGKSAAGLLLAERIGAVFVDTGIFYRAVTFLALERGVSLGDGRALSGLAGKLGVTAREPLQGAQVARVLIDGKPVADAEIRSAEVEANVSRVAAHPEVRAAVLKPQRMAAQWERAVVAGRDVGTVIFPQAQVKVYLDASPEERARRRSLERGAVESDPAVAQGMARRDAQDAARAAAPLARAPDAVVLHTDDMPLADVVDELERLVWGSVSYVER